MIYLVLLKLRTSLTTFKVRISDNSNPKNPFGGPHESRLSHTIDSCLAHQWKSIWMVNGPTIDQTSEPTKVWNFTLHSVSGRHHPQGCRPGTMDVDPQVDILAVSPVDIVAMMSTEVHMNLRPNSWGESLCPQNSQCSQSTSWP